MYCKYIDECRSYFFVGIITPLFFILIFLASLAYGYLIKKYLSCSKEIKRIELNARGPVNSFFSETSNGLFVVRAFKKENVFFKNFLEKAENYTRAVQNNMYLARWVGLRTDFFGTILITAAGYFGVLSRVFNYDSNSSLIGFSITWMLLISQMLSFSIRTLADTENFMSSVQKINDYIENTPQEPDFNFPTPSSSVWPSKGIIKATNLNYRYRDNLDYVIKGLTFETKPYEKIGVVGRTGSGKSTLTLGLLRILEISEDENGKMGKIEIDGEDVSNLGLHILRRNVIMIPQDPVLFSGTIKSNVDPFNEFNNDELKQALQKVNIMEAMKEGLETQVSDGGNNFSLGQKQLLCIARALIKKPKILIEDEATASIDEKTDHIIQKLIKNEFKETIVITIAHRLNTIIQYDRILVLENGYLKEFDTPLSLLKKGTSLFANLIKEYGKAYESKMFMLAENKEKNIETTDEPLYEEVCFEEIPNEIQMKVVLSQIKEKNIGFSDKKRPLMFVSESSEIDSEKPDITSEISIFQNF